MRRINLFARLSKATATYIGIDAYLVPIAIEDLWVFCGVADRSKNGRLASVRAPHDKNPEAAKLFPEFPEVVCVFCRHSEMVSVKKSAV